MTGEMRMAPLAVTLLLLVFQTSALAHYRSESYSSLTVTDDLLAGEFRIPMREATRFGADIAAGRTTEPVAADLVTRIVDVASERGSCSLVSRAPYARGYQLVLPVRADCEGARIVEVSFRRLFEIAPTQTHYVTLHGNGGATRRLALTRGYPRIGLDTHEPNGSVDQIYGFVTSGMMHVLSGWDHIAFLGVLLLMARQLRNCVIVATGFTVGHSITLALVAMELVVPNLRLAEVVIGSTIVGSALLAATTAPDASAKEQTIGLYLTLAVLSALAVLCVEFAGAVSPIAFAGVFLVLHSASVLQRQPSAEIRVPGMLAVAFGLVHGIGFASGLRQSFEGMSIGLLEVAAFNIGVEVGQLSVVLLGLALARTVLGLCRGAPHASFIIGQARYVSALAISGAGAYWCFSAALVA